MIDGRSVLSVIPARGGSKGLPRKNLVDICGKPLIAWSIDASHGSRLVDRTVLSSEDDEIIETARAYGCDVPFRRPAALAEDTSLIEDALIHALETLNERYDYLVLLHATSPLRSSYDIDRAIEICHTSGAPVCNSVVEVHDSPYWMFTMDDSGCLAPLMGREIASRRQDLPKVYYLNGGVHVSRADWFLAHRTFFVPEAKGYVMPRERSADLDDEMDLAIIRALLSHGLVP